MHPTIQKIFKTRKKLISLGKSHIDKEYALQFMKNFEYWDANAKDHKELMKNHREKLLYICPPTLVKKLREII